MKSKILNCLAVAAVCAASMASSALAQENPALFLGNANVKVAKAMAFRNQWDGPVSGPKISKKALVVFIGSDLRLGGVLGVANGLKEASKVAGWNLLILDSFGVQSRRAESFSRAVALKPDAIVFAGFDAADQPKEMKTAAAKHIPVIGWHAALKAGPVDGLYTNIGTDPKEAGQVAALLSVVESKGKASVVILSDASSAYSAAKAGAIEDIIKQCQTCSLLSVEDLAFSAPADHVQQQLTSLIKRHGGRWTHVIGTDDQYFDMMSAPAANTIIGAYKLQAISAGDGSPTAYQRIRNKTLQIGAVPEPLNMQGWQLLDEANRAIAGQPPSGYATPVYVVTAQNNAFHGGPKNSFDPDNGYRTEYKKIWGK